MADVYKFNPFTDNLDITVDTSSFQPSGNYQQSGNYALSGTAGTTSPGGSNLQIQYNSGGDFGGANIWYSGTNLGIGVSGPNNRLTVASSDSATSNTTFTAQMGLRNTNTTNNNFSVIAFQGVDTDGSAQGLVRLGARLTSHAVGALAADFYVDTTSGGQPSERMKILGAGGQVLISKVGPGSLIPTPGSLVAVGGQIKVFGDSSEGVLVVSAGAGTTPFLSGRMSRGTINSPTPVSGGDVLMRTAGGGYHNGSNYGGGVGAFEVQADGNFTATSQPSKLVFKTSPVGTTTEAERWTINNGGGLVITDLANSYLGYSPLVDATDRAVIHIGTAGALGDADIVAIGNRVSSGTVIICANTATAGGTGEKQIARFQGSGTQAVLIQGTSTAMKTLVVKASGTQTANIQEWQDNAGTPLVVVHSGGNVGIGTSSPLLKLDIETTASTHMKIGSKFPIYMVSPDPFIGYNVYYNAGWKFGRGSVGSYGGVFGFYPSTGEFDIYTTNAGNADAAATLTSRFTILQNGNIGLGTTTPGAVLEVNGNAILTSTSVDRMVYNNSLSGTIGMQAGSNTNFSTTFGAGFLGRGLRYGTNANQRGNAYVYAGSVSSPNAAEGTINFLTRADENRMIITQSGTVGIGTTIPQDTMKLHVAGNVRLDVSGTKPTTENSFILPVTEPIIGGTGSFLGDPAIWITINISGTNYKFPGYT